MKTRKSTNIFKETKLFHSIFLHQKCASKTTKIKTKRNAPNCIKHLCISCFSIAITGLYVNETINIKPTLMLFQNKLHSLCFCFFSLCKKMYNTLSSSSEIWRKCQRKNSKKMAERISLFCYRLDKSSQQHIKSSFFVILSKLLPLEHLSL